MRRRRADRPPRTGVSWLSPTRAAERFCPQPGARLTRYIGRDDRTCPMQQSLDRRQPSARFRPQLREIPLQRRHEAAGDGENDRRWTCRNEPASPVAIATTIGPEALEDHGPDLVGHVLAGVDVPGDVGLSAAP